MKIDMRPVRIRSIMNLICTPTMLFTPCTVIAEGFAGQDWNPYTDPVTGVVVQRLIAFAAEDDVVYYTHPMWTKGMLHLLFNSKQEGEEKALYTLRLSDKAVVQVAPVSSGYGVLARKSNRFYYLNDRDFYVRDVGEAFVKTSVPKLVASLPDNVKGQSGGMSLGAEEKSLYIGVTLKEENRWALMALDLASGKWRTVTNLLFQIGHIQASPFETGRIMFCHETGGFATQRTWVIREGDFAPKPMFKAPHDYWVTHESWWAKDKIVFTVWPYDNAHKKIPHGILSAAVESDQATVHARYPAWHTHGSPDGQWIVGDDFDRNIWLVKVATNERRLLSQGHKSKEINTHPHASFTPDSKAVIFNSSRDGQANIFLIELPDFAALAPQKEASP
jgi:oligogalacturonide lyase